VGADGLGCGIIRRTKTRLGWKCRPERAAFFLRVAKDEMQWQRYEAAPTLFLYSRIAARFLAVARACHVNSVAILMRPGFAAMLARGALEKQRRHSITVTEAPAQKNRSKATAAIAISNPIRPRSSGCMSPPSETTTVETPLRSVRSNTYRAIFYES
jgi:hypothetical protein